MTRQPIRFTQLITVKDTTNVDRDIPIGDNSLNGICFLHNVVSGVKYYGTLLSDGWYDFGALPDGFYKLYREEGTEVTKWHGSGGAGRWIGDGDYDATAIISGTFSADRIPGLSANKITSETFSAARIPDLPAGKITSDTFSADRIPELPASKIISGTFAEARLPNNINALKIGGGVVGSINFDKLAGVREVIQSRLDLALSMQTNSVIVDSTFAANSTNKFPTIQQAINYAQSQVPSLASPWFIYIMPKNAPAGYIENLTLQPHVHLIGVGLINITGVVSGGSFNSTLQNLIVTYYGNHSVTNIKASNSIFKVTNDDTGFILSLRNNLLLNCGLINNAADGEFNPQIVSTGGNVFIKCWSNIQAQIHATDKGSVDSLESYPLTF